MLSEQTKNYFRQSLAKAIEDWWWTITDETEDEKLNSFPYVPDDFESLMAEAALSVFFGFDELEKLLRQEKIIEEE